MGRGAASVKGQTRYPPYTLCQRSTNLFFWAVYQGDSPANVNLTVVARETPGPFGKDYCKELMYEGSGGIRAKDDIHLGKGLFPRC